MPKSFLVGRNYSKGHRHSEICKKKHNVLTSLKNIQDHHDGQQQHQSHHHQHQQKRDTDQGKILQSL